MASSVRRRERQRFDAFDYAVDTLDALDDPLSVALERGPRDRAQQRDAAAIDLKGKTIEDPIIRQHE